MKKLCSCLMLLLFMACYCTIYPQCTSDQTYPSGASDKLNEKRLARLKNILDAAGAAGSDDDWVAVKKYYFGDTYDSSLPDIICYIKKDSPPAISLVQEDKGNIKELFGEHFVWALVFADYDLTGRHSDTATIQLDVLEYEPGPREYTLSGVIYTLASVVTGGKAAVNSSAGQSLQDTSQIQVLKLTKYSNGGNVLYIGLVKFKIGCNTKNRIVVKAQSDDSVSNFQYINYNFGNYEKSRIGVSLGIGASFLNKFSDSNRVGPYLFLNYFIRRPRMPVNGSSFSAILGTNIFSGSLFEQILFGGRFVLDCSYPVGLAFGINWALSPDKVRRLGLFGGFDYGL